MKHGGISTSKSYGPYLSQDGYCHYNRSSIVIGAKITGYVRVKHNDINALKTAIVTNGPISVPVDCKF